jgi:hypothetical protein
MRKRRGGEWLLVGLFLTGFATAVSWSLNSGADGYKGVPDAKGINESDEAAAQSRAMTALVAYANEFDGKRIRPGDLVYFIWTDGGGSTWGAVGSLTSSLGTAPIPCDLAPCTKPLPKGNEH